jgi:hypothetical protein
MLSWFILWYTCCCRPISSSSGGNLKQWTVTHEAVDMDDLLKRLIYTIYLTEIADIIGKFMEWVHMTWAPVKIVIVLSPVRMYRGVLWFSRCYAASSAVSVDLYRSRSTSCKCWRILLKFSIGVGIGERMSGKEFGEIGTSRWPPEAHFLWSTWWPQSRSYCFHIK